MLRQIIASKHTFLSLGFLFIQQLIVASSTIWIADLSGAVINGQNIHLYLILFVSSLFVVYLPGMAAAYHLQKAQNKAIQSYTQIFSKKYFCKPSFLSDKLIREDGEAWLTSESGRTIEEVFSIGYDAISTCLNTVLNVLALCYVFGPKILIGYIACVLILPLVSKIFKKTLEKNAKLFQEDRKTMYQSLLSGWDNITTGNNYNYQIWWKQFCSFWKANDNSSSRAVVYTQLSSVSSMIFSLIPVAANFIWIFISTSSPVKLAALIATLPRQIQIMQHFEILTTYIMHWHGTHTRLKNMIESLTNLPEINKDDLIKRISWDDIHCKWNYQTINLNSFDIFLEFLNKRKNGHLTIEGKNGSGKTTLVNLIKQEMGEKVFYLPTNSHLLFEGSINKSFSTGQRVKTYLTEIAQYIVCKNEYHHCLTDYYILLLDEWNANLDLMNVKNISKELDRLSEKMCVIEISHRQDNLSQIPEEVFISTAL